MTMPYRLATSLMLLRHGAGAFRAPPKRNAGIGPRHQRPTPADVTSPLGTAALDSIPSLESILDDGRGHVNGDLARAVYEWEAALEGHESSKHFSTRDGLRLVDEETREILSSLGGGDGGEEGSGELPGVPYSDLIQEGMIALLRAMSTYDNYKSHNSSNNIKASTFREYARRSIHSSLLHFLARSGRPFRLPLNLQTTLEAANAAAEQLRGALKKEPSLAQVADAVGVPPARLALYRRLHRGTASGTGAFVSVEDGVEVYDPTLSGAGTGPRSRLNSVAGEGGDDNPASSTLTAAAPVEPTLDGLDGLDAEEDDWTANPPGRAVAPLRDVLPDAEEINDPLQHTHHLLLNEGLDDLLMAALTDEERTVIRLRFGLDDSKRGGRGWTANEIGERLGMDHDDVLRVAGDALEKLREAAPATWDDEDDALVEVSL